MPLFTPDATMPPSLYYSAGEAHPLATLAVDTIDHIVSDLRIHSSEREHYVTGWMGAHSVVIIHHYQDKRGTASGLVLTKEGELRLSVQSITFRIPKFLLWMSLRRRPRTMALITYGQLGERQSPLVQYSQLTDKALKQRLEQEWQALNDYVGMACYQLENDQPLWRTLMDSLSADALAQWVASSRFDDKRLQQDGDFTGFWAGNVFISRRQGAVPALQLLWRDAQNEIQPGYIYTLAASTAQAEANAQAQSRPALLIRPQRAETSFMLNAFDARHLQLAHDLLTYAAGILEGVSPPLMEMMDRSDTLPHA
ncbi:hypothetical protein [Sodalis sp. (in: enterobacteria)]|uniref:hypothetical protein n=1 Tax=Sodalis sp. (in: enterobacteria) TaxID=1898979 RepID=UPI003F36FF30